MNEVNDNKAWALCVVQDRNNICSKAMMEILVEYGVSRSAFYRAKKKITDGGIPGGGKTPILTPKQWENVSHKISTDFQNGKKTKTSEVSKLVLSYFL
jgi:hypothetical protein